MYKRTRTNCVFPISEFRQVKERVLNWTKQFNTFCFLDNHQYQIAPHTFECLLAVGKKNELKACAGNALDQLQKFIDKKRTWYFGHMGFDLKMETENIASSHFDRIGFPDLFFFEPEIVLRFNAQEMQIDADDPELIFDKIIRTAIPKKQKSVEKINIQQKLRRQEYIDIVEKLRYHILRGDCYEINFCQEFFAENVKLDPVSVYIDLSKISPNPFSALYCMDDKWLVCASPERFLKKDGNFVLSQPIKGTLKRTAKDDEISSLSLYHSAKDRSENVMVVDLVRNDLAKICKEGTVKVDELFGIYSFPQVFQMISTVSGELKENIPFSEMIRATFPMGSMTGAPKKSVLQLIERYEKSKRGIFSGAVGYIDESGNFDLNVVIRSIMYDASTKNLSFQTGSGITFYSDAEKEWEECMLKAEAIKSVLSY